MRGVVVFLVVAQLGIGGNTQMASSSSSSSSSDEEAEHPLAPHLGRSVREGRMACVRACVRTCVRAGASVCVRAAGSVCVCTCETRACYVTTS